MRLAACEARIYICLLYIACNVQAHLAAISLNFFVTVQSDVLFCVRKSVSRVTSCRLLYVIFQQSRIPTCIVSDKYVMQTNESCGWIKCRMCRSFGKKFRIWFGCRMELRLPIISKTGGENATTFSFGAALRWFFGTDQRPLLARPSLHEEGEKTVEKKQSTCVVA